MIIHEMYKSAKIIKHDKAQTFCASFQDGSWFGWSSIARVKQHIDEKIWDWKEPTDIDSTLSCMRDS